MQHAAGGCPGFSLWPVSARADALETGGDFREATGEPASSDGELSDETGSQEESAGKDGDLDAENSDAAGTVGEEEITAVEEQVDFSEEIVVTGTAETEEADGADASGTGADGGTKRLWYSAFLIWIRTKKGTCVQRMPVRWILCSRTQ